NSTYLYHLRSSPRRKRSRGPIRVCGPLGPLGPLGLVTQLATGAPGTHAGTGSSTRELVICRWQFFRRMNDERQRGRRGEGGRWRHGRDGTVQAGAGGRRDSGAGGRGGAGGGHGDGDPGLGGVVGARGRRGKGPGGDLELG